MKFCLVSPSDSKQKIRDKLNHLFDKAVKIVRVTKSGDMFDCCNDEHKDGESLLEIDGNG
jgi:hypothetical protein